MKRFLDKLINHHVFALAMSWGRTFRLENSTYSYLVHTYNTTWRNERAVEIPIVQAEIGAFKGGDVLEVGNVLSHYQEVSHTVLDKYEIAENVINEDIVDFEPNKTFDLILSISTLEHVGFDEEVKDPDKIFVAIERMMSWLKPNGKLIVTLPLGYNPQLDESLSTQQLPFTSYRYIKRFSNSLDWREVDASIFSKHVEYNRPFPNANVIVVAEFVNS